MMDTHECCLTFKWEKIQDDVIRNMGFLRNIVNLPRDAMKIVRFIIFYLLEKDTSGE